MSESQPKGPSSGEERRFPPDLAIVLLVLIWGSNFSVVKSALSEFSPLAFNATRFVLASAVLAVYMAAFGKRVRFEKGDVLRLVGLGLLGNVVYQALFIFGIDGTRAGNAALMLSTVPFIVTVLSVALKHETISQAGWAGVALSISGIVLILWGSSRGPTASVRTPCEATSSCWLRRSRGRCTRCLPVPTCRKYGTLSVTAFTMWIGTIGLVAVSTPALLAQDWIAISPGAWGGLVFSGAFSLALAYILWYYGIRHLGSSRTAVYSNTVPVVALLVAWITLGEVPTLVAGRRSRSDHRRSCCRDWALRTRRRCRKPVE